MWLPSAIRVAIACASLSVPLSAGAAEVHVEEGDSGPLLVYRAAPDESNSVGVGRINGEPDEEVYVNDTGAPLTAGPGCRRVEDDYSVPHVSCRSDVVELTVTLGDLDDQISFFRLFMRNAHIDGGTGDDVIGEEGLAFDTGPVRLRGGPGNDWVAGTTRNDTIEGGRGHDRLVGGQGSDAISGGPGVDEVIYSGVYEPTAATAVFVSLDGRGPDGAGGERDRIAADVEDAAGASGGDELFGSVGPNVLTGGGGDDDIVGGPGRDVLLGDEGDDKLRARDGRRDVVACGAGKADRAFVDPRDDVGVECERVQVRRVRPAP